MDDLVLDHILEFVDGDTLLTGRLVCQRWKTEITKRNGLWRRRCEGLGADESDKVFPSTTDFFRLFVNLRKELGEMSFRENWQVNDHCDGSRCVIHKELTRRWERERHEDWVTKIVPRLRKKEHFGKKIVVCTRQGELVVLDEEKKEVAWRTEQLVYRMDDGTLVGEIPVFINGDNLAYVYTAETVSHSSIVETVNQVQFIEGRLNKDKSRPVSIHLLNAKWLDGLSSSTTNQDFPVAVIYSREHPWGRCIRWSEGLWGKLLPSKPKSDQASDDIAD
ncbi:hypothetical protein ACOMHN_036926 [Nucella lapillus]